MVSEEIFLQAVKTGDLSVLRDFVEQGGNINCVTDHGCTALQRAATAEHLSCMAFLIEKGADLNQADADGDTPFLDAVIKGKKYSVKMLLNAGVDDKAVNLKGLTANGIAIERGHHEIKGILEAWREARADEVDFVKLFHGKILEEIYDFNMCERISLLCDPVTYKVDSMTREAFTAISEKAMRLAFNEHAKRGGKCSEWDVGLSGTVRLKKISPGSAGLQ